MNKQGTGMILSLKGCAKEPGSAKLLSNGTMQNRKRKALSIWVISIVWVLQVFGST
jgi:hypothetical protein